MVKHTYNGETFKVAKSLSAKERDNYCARILSAKLTRSQGESNPAFEVERMPESSLPSVPNKRGRPRKVILSDTGEIVPATDTGAPENALYAQGFYRVACATCGEGIIRTGARGRAPKFHDKCRPTEEG